MFCVISFTAYFLCHKKGHIQQKNYDFAAWSSELDVLVFGYGV